VRADGRAPPARTAGHLLLDPASGRTGALEQAFNDLTRTGWCDPSGRLQPLFG
jgi:hypothetical protein